MKRPVQHSAFSWQSTILSVWPVVNATMTTSGRNGVKIYLSDDALIDEILF